MICEKCTKNNFETEYNELEYNDENMKIVRFSKSIFGLNNEIWKEKISVVIFQL